MAVCDRQNPDTGILRTFGIGSTSVLIVGAFSDAGIPSAFPRLSASSTPPRGAGAFPFPPFRHDCSRLAGTSVIRKVAAP